MPNRKQNTNENETSKKLDKCLIIAVTKMVNSKFISAYKKMANLSDVRLSFPVGIYRSALKLNRGISVSG